MSADAGRRYSKRTQIVAAAKDLFLRLGYEGASIELIAEAAQVSKQTIYNNFADKEALFRAIAEDLVDEVVAPLLCRETGKDSDMRGVLTSLGESFLGITLDPCSLALHRLVVMEAPRFPELGLAVYAAGASRAVEQLAMFLDEQANSGDLRLNNATLAAEQFFGLIMGHHQLRALLGVEAHVPPARIRGIVQAGVDLFLAALQGDSSNADRSRSAP